MPATQTRPLDLRQFQDIVDEARRLIPRYCPEWTDHNVSDPGITLIELFAWMTEMILYQVNRVPDAMYERFLDMVGIHREPPAPARADVTLYLAAPRQRPITIPAETEVATERTEQEEAIVFATTAPLTIMPPNLIALRAWREGQGFEDYLPYVSSGLIEGPMFNESPQEDDAFYMGYSGNLWGYSLQLRIDCQELEGSHIDPRDPPLEWEYWSGTERSWARVRLLDQSGLGAPRDRDAIDPTHGLNRSADVYLHVPLDSTPTTIDGIEASWIRIRYVPKDDQAYTRSPRISRLRSDAIAATVPARQAQFMENEFIGQSDGTPGQSFQLRAGPVLHRDEAHIIEARHDDEVVQWREVADFSQSGDGDLHFVINYHNMGLTADPTDGEIRFGPEIRNRDGTARQYGAVPRKGALLRISSYYSGGGTIGNVGEGAITQLKTSIPYIAAVMNYRPAAGGLNEESLEQAKLRSLSILKRSEVAITREDYVRLAEEVDGVGRACCLTPDQDQTLAVGTLRLLVLRSLPDASQALSPEDMLPSPFLIQALSSHLDERKSLGTVVLYGGVDVTWVEIDAHIYVRRGVDVQLAEAEAVHLLRQYLHPIDGRPAGKRWAFGGSVTESQVAGLLQTTPGVAYVERVRLRAQGDNKENSRIQAPPSGLLALARCYVLVEVLEDDV